jgi:hypothetical protein
MTRRSLFPAPAAALAQAPVAPPAAQLKTRSSKEIAASPLSIGFETLDREMFDPEHVLRYLAALGVKWARRQTVAVDGAPVKDYPVPVTDRWLVV